MERSASYYFREGRVDIRRTVRPRPVVPLPIAHWALKWAQSRENSWRRMREVVVFWDDAVPEHVDIVVYLEDDTRAYLGVEIPERVLRQAKV